MIPICLTLLLMGSFLYSLIRKKPTLFSACLTLLILIHDVLFVSLKNWIPGSLYFPIKSWQEILTLVGLFFFIRKKIKPDKLVFFLTGLLVYGLLFGIFQGTKPFEIFKGFRMYMLIIIGLVLLYQSEFFKEINVKIIFQIFIAFTTLSSLYSIFMDYIFIRDLKVLWFYDFVNQINPIESARFNYIRDGSLRACGLFISPLIQSILLGFSTLILALFTFKNPEKRNPAWFAALFLTNLFGLMLCRTRIGWFVLMGGLILAITHLYYQRLTLYQSYLLPVILILGTLFILLFGFTNDPSALGRIPQYKLLFTHFNFFGFGFGHPSTLTVYDSMYISAGLTFGVLGIVYILIPILACRQLFRLRNNFSNPEKIESLYFAATYGFSFILLYVFAFQFTLGSPTVLLFYFLVYSFSINVRTWDAK